MRKVFFILALFSCGVVYAAPQVAEAPIKDVGTPVTISLSSTTLTMVPSSQTSGRFGIYVSNPSTTTVSGFYGNCTSTILASTIRPISISSYTYQTYYSMRDDVCLWLLSLSTTGPTSIHYQEVKQ